MKYARPSKHYRAAKKQAEEKSRERRYVKGTFISQKDKPKIVAMGVAVTVLSFLLGFFIGSLLESDD